MIYLDNASTSFPKAPGVADAIAAFLTEIGASPGRGGYAAAVASERIAEDVRRRLTRLVGGRHPERMIFTASCTDALNLAIRGVLREGDHVVTTLLEHNSVSRPLQALADAGFIVLSRVKFSAGGFVDPDDVAAALTPRTRLVAVTHASNVLGAIQPIAEIGRLLAEHDAYFLVDAAQSIGLLEIDVAAQHIDLLAFPTHKELLGPPGLGALYVAPHVDIEPWRLGGTGADSAAAHYPAEWPHRLEAGTLNMVGIAGLQAALEGLNPPAALVHVRAMMDRLLAGIADVPGVHLYGLTDPRRCVGALSLCLDPLPPEDLGAVLDASFGICVRSGLHCSPYTHRHIGTFPEGTVRVSPGPYTTAEEIDRFIEAIRELAGTG
jgi:cysteine desulfurase family protein